MYCSRVLAAGVALIATIGSANFPGVSLAARQPSVARFRPAAALRPAGTAYSVVRAGGTGGEPIRVADRGAVITYGRTEGEVAGYCMRAPAIAPAYTVRVFGDGRVAAPGVPRSYAASRVTPAIVRRLVHRAMRERFFHIPSYSRDTSCAGASTAFIRIRWRGKDHLVEVYGYQDSRHPALRDLFRVLARLTGVES